MPGASSSTRLTGAAGSPGENDACRSTRSYVKDISRQSVMSPREGSGRVEPAGVEPGRSATVRAAPVACPSDGVTVIVSPVPKVPPGVYTTLDTDSERRSLVLTVPRGAPVTENEMESLCASVPARRTADGADGSTITVLVDTDGAVFDEAAVSACVLASANGCVGVSPRLAALTVTVYLPGAGVKKANSTGWRAELLVYDCAASVAWATDRFRLASAAASVAFACLAMEPFGCASQARTTFAGSDALVTLNVYAFVSDAEARWSPMTRPAARACPMEAATSSIPRPTLLSMATSALDVAGAVGRRSCEHALAAFDAS